jgi:hypothetical protein
MLPILTLGGVFFLALAVRYHRLSEALIWVDEIFSWAVAHLRPSVLISYLYRGNNPPLWELPLSGTGFCGSGFQLPCYGACFSLLTGERV